MQRVTGIGGIFMSAKDPKALCAWYKKHLGIDVQAWGGTAFTWTDSAGNPTKGTTIWSVSSAESSAGTTSLRRIHATNQHRGTKVEGQRK